MKKENFSSVTFVLFSITFLCAKFAGMLWKIIPKDIGTGMAIMFFGTLMHFIALLYTIFVKQEIASSVIIGMFLAFWGFNSCGLIFSYNINPILNIIEPVMILFIIFIARKSYKYQTSAKNILLYGLVPLIALLWLNKTLNNTVFLVFTKYFIMIVGIWAFILMLKQLPEPNVPLKVIKDLLGYLNCEEQEKNCKTFRELDRKHKKLIKKLLEDDMKEDIKIFEIIGRIQEAHNLK